ncbi:uncharacterized protein LOC133914336 [Phragmites australis]|uniref:uncharacterized protein LOC133914336 n=1 Tax=Phragmites australis TaxID=29695 RepID=UPI002D77646E|nr:uncharacterized protein LOC133914336 [Phragmites australis]
MSEESRQSACRQTNEQVEALRACDRARYANMTPGQRKARRDHENVRRSLQRNNPSHESRQVLTMEKIEARHACDRAQYANVTPKQKKARRDRENARRALRRNTPILETIAMKNTMDDPVDNPLLVSISVPVEPIKDSDCATLASEGYPMDIHASSKQSQGTMSQEQTQSRHDQQNAHKQARRARDRARYANMTPMQRQVRRDRQNTQRALRSNTPCKESIAMVNLLWQD